MGAVVSTLSRRIMRFNIENRAHREISKEKPTPAPAYPSTTKEIERMSKEHPQFIEEQSQKDTELYERLKSVYLTSYGVKVETKPAVDGSGRPLPAIRNTPEETDFGFVEPKMIPRGRVTLRQALKFIAEYQSDHGPTAASTIAAKHNISLEVTENILQHFKTFELFIPENKEKIQGERIVITQIEEGKPTEQK